MNLLSEYVLIDSPTYAKQQLRAPNNDTKQRARQQKQVEIEEEEVEEEGIEYDTHIVYSPSKEVVELGSEDWDKDSVSEREQEPMTAPVYEEESDTDIPFPTPVQKRIKRANAGTNQRYKD
jgi:hypothetical protein